MTDAPPDGVSSAPAAYGHRMHPGSLLRAMLEEADMSQVAAAELLGYSQKHLNQVLQGKVRLSVDLAVAAEQRLGQSGDAEKLLVAQVRQELYEKGVNSSASS